ncbi:hypothetical protein ACFWY9_24985 [Amycolatopsis sp. NPDC059027]|uniref:hypothetical protein n=1 Tax=Amycolatopsis sp. NPDC059027 TaxID=3346709 RepID=UPI0036714815
MSRRSAPRAFAATAAALLFAVLPGLGPTATAAVPAPPPLPFVSQLDLFCQATDPYTPPPVSVSFKRLNPVLANLGGDTVRLGTRDQLCVPVAKNGNIPPAGIVDFVRWVDLSCYRVQGRTVEFPLRLSQLNPVVRKLGARDTEGVIGTPEQLCVPVAKNGKIPPPDVLRFVQHIDLVCYSLKPQDPLGIPLTLSHLNPLLAGLPKFDVRVTEARDLCVPVLKSGDEVPGDVLNTVRWVDLEKFDVVGGPNPGPAVLTLKLTHLNPVLAKLPVETAKVAGRGQLALPVAKNGLVPPEK